MLSRLDGGEQLGGAWRCLKDLESFQPHTPIFLILRYFAMDWEQLSSSLENDVEDSGYEWASISTEE